MPAPANDIDADLAAAPATPLMLEKLILLCHEAHYFGGERCKRRDDYLFR
jgi:hypothetical protein